MLKVLEMTDEVALMDEEGATGDAAACDEDNRADETAGVSAGADDGDGGTVVYCVTITTGGTGSEVEGRSSTAETEDWIGEGAGTAGSVWTTCSPSRIPDVRCSVAVAKREVAN